MDLERAIFALHDMFQLPIVFHVKKDKKESKLNVIE